MSEPTALPPPPAPRSPCAARLPAAVDTATLLSPAGEHHTRAVFAHERDALVRHVR